MEIKLRAIEPEDIEAIYRWENDETLWIYSATHQPFSRRELLRYIEESSGMDIYASRQLRLIADSDGAIGCIDLYDFDPFNRRAGIGIIVDQAVRHNGVGTAMLGQMEQFVREYLELHQLYAVTATYNKSAVALFAGCGYDNAGTLSEWIRTPEGWCDAYQFQKLLS